MPFLEIRLKNGPVSRTGPSPVNDLASPPHGRVSREEIRSTLGTDSRVARVGLIDEWVRRGKGLSGLVGIVPTPLEEGG
jgi:hypothetical protein